MQAFKQLTASLQRKINLVLGRGILTGVDDSQGIQLVQGSLLKGETRDGMERLENYGFTSNPQEGAEFVAGFLEGNRDVGFILALGDRRFRFKNMAKGEVAIYTDEGDRIHFKRGNEIEIVTNTLTINAATKVDVNSPAVTVNSSNVVQLNTPAVNITGELTVDGQIRSKLDITSRLGQPDETTVQNFVDTYNIHTHDENADTVTDPPNEQV